MIDSILNKVPAKPTSLKPGLSAGLEHIVLKSLERDPACRYQSAREMASDLQRLSTSELSLPFSPPAPVARLPRFAVPRVIWRALAFVGLLSVTAFTVSYLSSRHTAMDSIAILPFTNISGTPETEYLSDGITDALINSVSQLPNLKVISGSSVIRYRGKVVDPQTLGHELNVRAVLIREIRRKRKQPLRQRGVVRHPKQPPYMGRAVQSQSFRYRCRAGGSLPPHCRHAAPEDHQ